jgi:uncharacterized membrane protein YraQ (UPF0718 family)
MEYLKMTLNMAVDMGFYMMIGLLLVAVANLFLKKEFIADHLGSDNLWSIAKASLLGVPLPLCSCGVIPAGMYIKEKGGSNAATVSFLVSTPQTGVDSIAATYGMMGLTFAWFRPLAAFLSGILTGILVKIFGKKADVPSSKKSDETCTDGCCCTEHESDTTEINKSIMQRTVESLKFTFGEFLSDISLHFLIGVLIALLIMVLIPDDLIVQLGLQGGIAAMLAMIVIGLPMYICSTSSIPIALTLLVKGISPGAAFVFLFMGPFSNIASLVVLSKKLGKRTLVIYIAGAVISALAFGFLLDGLSGLLPFPDFSAMLGKASTGAFGILKYILAAAFYVFIFKSIFIKIKTGLIKNKAHT